jgi:predicted nucleic acid-binding Zn ribbon protein
MCPDCGRKKVRRLLGTGAGLLFKGGGFYQTDYRSEGYRKAQAKEQSPCAKAGGDCTQCEKKADAGV